MKIKINLPDGSSDCDKMKICDEYIIDEVMPACLFVLRQFPDYQHLIKQIRVDFVWENSMLGPKFSITFVDFFGKKTIRKTDFRFIGKEDGKPSRNEIEVVLVDIFNKEINNLLLSMLSQAKKVSKKIMYLKETLKEK